MSDTTLTSLPGDNVTEITGLTPRGTTLPPEPEPSAAFGRIGAFGRREPGYVESAFEGINTVVNGLRWMTEDAFPPDPDFTGDKLLERIRGTRYEADHLDSFVGVRSEAEMEQVKRTIDRELMNRDIYARSGFGGYVAGVAAGVLDPTIFIPIGGWARVGANTLRATRFGVRAAEGAAVTGAAVGAQELVLQGTQETRTTMESLFNVGSAVLAGGVIGGALGVMTRAERDAIGKWANDIPATPEEMRAVEASGIGAAASDSSRGSGELKSTFGVAETLGQASPRIRAATSPFKATRNTVRDLTKGAETLEENASGVASSVGGAVEAQVDAALGEMLASIERTRRFYSDYFFGRDVPFAPATAGVFRIMGRGRGRMSYDEFKEAVAWSALNGDQHPVPQVAAAAAYRRAHIVNPLRDEAMDAIPGFREQVEAASADPSYLTRIWNQAIVRARRNELEDILGTHFRGQQAAMLSRLEEAEMRAGVTEEMSRAAGRDVTELSDNEIKKLAEEVVDTILAHTPNRIIMPGNVAGLTPGPRGPLKERMLLSLPSSLVRDFIERDIEMIDNFYVRTMATDVALAKKFGSVDLKDQIQKISDEANAASKGKPPKQVAKIQKRKEHDIRDINALLAQVRGTYKLPVEPEGLMHRSVSAIKSLNFLSSLGMMTVSSISDLGKPIAVHGLTRVMKTAFHPFVRGLSAVKLAKKDVKLAGAGWDMVTNDRVMSFADLIDEGGRGTIAERALARGGRVFSVLTLMAPWNAVAKQFSGIITITRALEDVEAIARGRRVPTGEVEYLASGGIDAGMAGRIAAQFERHGGKDGAIWWANTEAWTDRQAVLALRSFVNRDVDRIIVTPGAGDRPLIAHGDIGSLVTQFQSFALASVQRTLMAGLQQRDMAALNGFMLMFAMGAVSYSLKTRLAGYETSDNPAVWAREAFDNAGIAGWAMNVNNTVEKWTGDRIGLSALTGEPARRYLNVNRLGSILGPTLGKAEDMTMLFDAATGGGITASDVHKARKMLPLQNLFYLRWLFDAAERKTTEAMGIPARRTN